MTVSEELDARIGAVFGRALRVDPNRLGDETRRGQLEEWDSLGHLSIVRELEDEFDVQISPEMALELETIADIKRLLAQG